MKIFPLFPRIFFVVLLTSTVCAAQLKECDPGKVLRCARECYPSCNGAKQCPEIASCLRKECQCPKGKVDSGTGECIHPDHCTVQVRKSRVARA
ncbi:hypothetical protein Aduo_011378 [Ancylostoma duodenale]